MKLCELKTKTLNKYIKFYYKCISISLMLLCLFLISCDRATDPNTGTLKGFIELENDTLDPSLSPSDYSGVSVLLYQFAEYDTTLMSIQSSYPSVGVQLDQETEFDHRLQNPIVKDITKADGSFTLTNVPIGVYNLVYFKQNWGMRIVYQIEILEGSNEASEAVKSSRKLGYMGKESPRLTLYPQIDIPPSLLDEYTFRRHHTYNVRQDAVFVSDVIFEESSLVLIDPGMKMSFYADVSTPMDGSRWKIMSSSRVFSTSMVDSDDIDRFQKISFSGGTLLELNNGIVRDIQDGVSITSNIAEVTNMRFSNGGSALVYSGESLLYSNNTVTGFDDRAHMIYGNAMIERNTFVANNDCLIIHEATYTVKNNYFARNWVGVRPVYGDTVIQNNAFSDNTYSISTMASSSSIIYNNFYGSSRYCIQTQANYVQGYFDYSNPLINDNNFYAINQIIISIKPDSHPGYFGSGIVGVVCNIDATRNYWAASNINDVILDNNDGIEEIAYMVNYLPVATNQIAMAGIQ